MRGDWCEGCIWESKQLAEFLDGKRCLDMYIYNSMREKEKEREKRKKREKDFFVLRTCNGPLLPTTFTERTLLLASASSAYSVTSVCLSLSTPHSSILATSSATLPWPMTTACSPRRRRSGSTAHRFSGFPLYHPTKSRAEHTPRSVSSPGMPSLLSREAPYDRISPW